MKNKKVVGLLLAGSMLLSSMTAFADVNVEKDTYKFGEKVNVTTDSYDFIQISDFTSGEAIHFGTSEATASGWGYTFQLPTSTNNSYQNTGRFVNGGKYTVVSYGADKTTTDTFTISDSTTQPGAPIVSPSVGSRAYIGWNNNIAVFSNHLNLLASDTVNIKYTLYKNGMELTLDQDYDAAFAGNSAVTNLLSNVTVSDLNYAGLDLYFRTSGSYELAFTITDSNGNVINDVNVRYPISVSNIMAGGTGSGGGSGSGSINMGGSTWIPGITGANTASGINVQLNPSQETVAGVKKNVAYTASYVTPDSFKVGVIVDGVPATSFEGYDPVYVQVPYSANLTDTSTLVVKDANGNIVPRSLYMNGKMYVNVKDLSTTYTIVNNPKSFADVHHDWAVKQINALAAREIINGVGENLYDPDRAVTRAEFTKMIVTMFDVFEPSAVSTFADIDNSQWYAPYVATAQKLAITNGYAEDNTFRPNQIISREEMSAMLYRAAEVLSVDITAKIAQTTFSDDASIQEYAKVPVYKMQQAEVLKGVGNNLFDPQGTCTRAQAAVAIYNMFVLSMTK